MEERRLANIRNIYNLDIKISIIWIILSIIFILIPPFNQTFLRIILALPLLLFMPGYFFIAVMFPKRGELGTIERLTLSIGLSIAIVVFDGFGLNFTTWGFRPNSIVISISIIMGLLLIAALFLRKRFKENAYSFSSEDIISFYETITSKEIENGQEYDPGLEKTLIRTMIIAIILVGAVILYANITREPEKFTAIYILGENGKAEDYPSEITIGEPVSIPVGVENHEYTPVNYTLRITLGGNNLFEQVFALDHDAELLEKVQFIPKLSSSLAFAGENKSKLEFQLLRDNQPYRSVHLWVKVNLDPFVFAELPEIINGDMETDTGWALARSNSNISASYDHSTNFSSRVYKIDFNPGKEISFATIYQNLFTNGDGRALLSFYIKDSEYTNTSYYIFKQVLLDEKVIWESRIGGKNSSWEKVEVPLLLSGNNTLALRVFNKYITNQNVTVWIDNVELNPYGTISNQTEVRPKSKLYEFKLDVRGEPHVMNRSMKVDGFSFSGFYYNLSQNKSYEELILNVSENNTIGPGNATYIKQSIGNELFLMGSRYKIPGKDISNISKLVETYPNSTIGLGRSWSFGWVYSLKVNLISSRGDSAMLELKKSNSVLDSKLVNRGGIYEYKKNIGKSSVTIFRAKVDDIIGENVYLNDIELFADELTNLKNGTVLGDFEVANVSSDLIILRNLYPIPLSDKTTIFNGTIGLSLRGNLLYPYASGVTPRGTPQYIYYNRWMNITGINYAGFLLDNNVSYEDLSMYFSENGSVEPGKAVYRTRRSSDRVSFLGNMYEAAKPESLIYLRPIGSNYKIKLYENKNQRLGNGFNISFRKLNNSDDEVIIFIRKSASVYEQKLIKIINDTRFEQSMIYDMYTGRYNNMKKSNVLGIGESFEYWLEYREDQRYKAFSGELVVLNNDSIEMDIREYGFPFEISPGKSFGEFEVDSVISDTITLRNRKSLKFDLGKRTPILNGALKIVTSSKEYLAYPTR